MKKCFKERIKAFWSKFIQDEAYIRKLIDNTDEIDKAYDYINDLLNIAFEEIYFEIGVNDEKKYELILTPEGSREKLFLLYEWYIRSNEELKDKWNFYYTRPRIKEGENFNINMYDINLIYEDVYIIPEIDFEQKRVNLKVYCEKLTTLNETERYNLFFILLDMYISEIYSMDFIGYIDFYEKSKDNILKKIELERNNISKDEFDMLIEEEKEDDAGNQYLNYELNVEIFEKISISMNKLKSYIDEVINQNKWKDYENPFDRFYSYHMQPSTESDYDMREDVIAGACLDISIINEYYNYSDKMYNRNYENGVVYGFLFFENININQNEVISVRINIEDEIVSLIEEHGIGKLIGGATGFYYSYMDFIIFDFKEFLKISKIVLNKYNFKEKGFKKFKREDKIIMFN